MMPQPSMLILLVVTSAMTLMPASAQDGPMQTASPAISDKVSSFERAARVNNAGFSSTATGRDVNSFDPAAATLAWLDSVPRNQREKSDAYFEGGYWLILWNFLLAAAISIFLLASRISALLRNLAELITRFVAYLYILCREKIFPSKTKRRIYLVGPSGKPAEDEKLIEFKALQVILYAIPFILLTSLLAFPLTAYEHFFREHAYGLATQNFGQWFREQLIALVVNLFVTSLVLV